MRLGDYLTERFIRSPGPGGQNVNKVASAVELRFDARASGLPDDVIERLRAIAGSRMNARDVLVIHAHEHRTQKQNREAARRRLEALIARASKRPRARRATRPSAAAKERRVQSKQRRGQLKKSRARQAGED